MSRFHELHKNVEFNLFHVGLYNDDKEMYKKDAIHEGSCCFVNLSLLLFCRSRCLRRRHSLSSLILNNYWMRFL